MKRVITKGNVMALRPSLSLESRFITYTNHLKMAAGGTEQSKSAVLHNLIDQQLVALGY